MATKTKRPKYGTSIQLWPGGKTIEYQGEPLVNEADVRIRDTDYNTGRKSRWRKPTKEEMRELKIELHAERIIENDVLVCDSSLVDDLIKLAGEGEVGRAFDMASDNFKNLRPDPSDWTLERCKEWLEDKGHDLPDPNPFDVDETNFEGRLLLAHTEEEVMDGAIPSDPKERMELYTQLLEDDKIEEFEGTLDAFRDAVRDNATNEEVYQWFRVNRWLAGKLEEVGEVVLDNDYGQWWGRGGCGQAIVMDGTFQKVAALIVDR